MRDEVVREDNTILDELERLKIGDEMAEKIFEELK